MAVSTYQWGNVRRSSFQVERWSWSLRGWLIFALVLAVAFHWWLYYLFNNLDLGRKMISQNPVEPPRSRVVISPELLKEQKAVQNIPDVLAPSEKPPEPKTKADLQ